MIESKAEKVVGYRRGVFRLVALLLGIGCITWVAVIFDLDRKIAGFFYHPDTGWYLKDSQPWAFLYRYGPVPGLVLSIAALFGTLVTSRNRFKRLYPYRKQMLVVGLTCLLGAGLIVNGVLKPGWGRPRPRQTVAFGGTLEFKHPYQPGVLGQGESFPSGHASMGFLFITLACFRSCNRGQALFGVAIGVLYGSLIGLGRIVQGAHFFTDILFSLGIISMVAVALNDLILPRFFIDASQRTDCSVSRKISLQKSRFRVHTHAGDPF
jgi:lipid A 4'-phosphatase